MKDLYVSLNQPPHAEPLGSFFFFSSMVIREAIGYSEHTRLVDLALRGSPVVLNRADQMRRQSDWGAGN